MLGDLPQWDLNDLYASINDSNLSSDKIEIEELTEIFINKYQNKIDALSSKDLNEAISNYQIINQKLGKLYSYVSLSFSINTDKPDFGKKYQEIRELGSIIFSKLVFFELEIMNLNGKTSKKYLNDNNLSLWKPWLRKIFQRKPFQLSNDLEQFIAEKGPSGRGAWVRLFDESSSDLRFQIKGDTLSETEILNLLSDPDADLRKNAGFKIWEPTTQKNLLIIQIMLTNSVER